MQIRYCGFDVVRYLAVTNHLNYRKQVTLNREITAMFTLRVVRALFKYTDV